MFAADSERELQRWVATLANLVPKQLPLSRDTTSLEETTGAGAGAGAAGGLGASQQSESEEAAGGSFSGRRRGRRISSGAWHHEGEGEGEGEDWERVAWRPNAERAAGVSPRGLQRCLPSSRPNVPRHRSFRTRRGHLQARRRRDRARRHTRERSRRWRRHAQLGRAQLRRRRPHGAHRHRKGRLAPVARVAHGVGDLAADEPPPAGAHTHLVDRRVVERGLEAGASLCPSPPRASTRPSGCSRPSSAGSRPTRTC